MEDNNKLQNEVNIVEMPMLALRGMVVFLKWSCTLMLAEKCQLLL